MNSVFSLDDFSDQLWQPPSPPQPMNRSASEWALEKFLAEISAPASPSASATTNASVAVAVSHSSTSPSKPEIPQKNAVEIHNPQNSPPPPHHHPDRNPMAPIDPEDHSAFLTSRPHIPCAAVAISRPPTETDSPVVKPEGYSLLAEVQSLGAGNSLLGSQDLGHGTSTMQSEVEGGSTDLPALPAMQRKQDVQVRQTTSGSSREDSDDDEVEGGTETNDLADAKRARRMLSNRESARRSRRRKQAQLDELETQVGQLRDERTSLLSRYTDINKKCDDASVDNRILKANIETLRTKVKMAEEQVKQVTGINPMILARSNMPSMGMQFVGSQVDVSSNVAIQMQPNSNQFFHQPVPSVSPAAPPPLQRPSGSFPNGSNLVPIATNLQTEIRASNVRVTRQSMANIPSIGTSVVHESGLSRAVVAKDNPRK